VAARRTRAAAIPAGPADDAVADDARTAAAAGPRDEAAVGRFVELLAGILFEWGVPRMPARVFVALLAADSDRLSAAELAAILGVSPAAVSGAVRYLVQVGLATGAGEPGSRRLFYSVPSGVWERLLTISSQQMSRWTAALRAGVDVLGTDSPGGERMSESVRYFDFVAAELPGLLARWHERKAAPGGPG
jgi:DNA-binding transcriptional regulator GbsR (MarR family)